MNKTKIDWCDMSWNPVTGCKHECIYCYARGIAHRFEGYETRYNANFEFDCGNYVIEERMYKSVLSLDGPNKKVYAPYPFGFVPTFHHYRLGEPARKEKQQNIFVCSMADLFGEWTPDEWIGNILDACLAAPNHRYLFLTKNPDRYHKLNGQDHKYDWEWVKSNWWFGITVTSNKDIDKLRKLPYGSTNTFVSIEPLLSEIDLNFYVPKHTTRWKCSFCGNHADHYSLHCSNCGKEGGYSGSFRNKPINWVIIGTETGNQKGKIIPQREWIENIVIQCRAVGIPIFMKNSLGGIWGNPLIQEFPW